MAPAVHAAYLAALGHAVIGVDTSPEMLAHAREAALPLGLQVRRCEEPRRPSPLLGEDGTVLYDGVRPPDDVPGRKPPNIWSLHARAVTATNAAWRANPAAIIWHFQLPAA